MLFTTCPYITANMLLKHFDSLLLMTYKTINRETVQWPLLYLFARMGQIWTFIIKFVLPILPCDFRGLYRSPRSQVVYRCNNNFQTFYGVLYGLTCCKSNTPLPFSGHILLSLLLCNKKQQCIGDTYAKESPSYSFPQPVKT